MASSTVGVMWRTLLRVKLTSRLHCRSRQPWRAPRRDICRIISSMSHRPSVRLMALAALVAGTGAIIAQSPSAPATVTPAARWQRAVDAWEAGSYPAALADLGTLMRSPAAAEYFDRVALLTGELYVTTVLTTETPVANAPRISGNGSYASYQTGAAAAALTSIIKLDPKPEKVAELPTALVAFDRAGRRVAWLRQVTPGNPEASEL